MSSSRQPMPRIVCVDCGGSCSLITPPREDGVWLAGDLVTYRCRDCLDRWDLVLPDDWDGDEPQPDPTGDGPMP